MTRAYIGLGANLGQPLEALRAARAALIQHPSVQLCDSSFIYRSAAVGPGPQPDYLNAVLALDTPLTAPTLLTELQRLEDKAGRLRNGERWGPRVLDLDLLLYGAETIDTPRLQVPHPRLFSRNFVLLPLADLCAADWRFPDGSTIEQHCKRCPANPIERTGLDWHTGISTSSAGSGSQTCPR